MTWEEDEFPHVAPAGVVPVRDFVPWDAYVPDYDGVEEGIEVVELVIERMASLAKELRLKPPVVYFVEDTEMKGHVARFMDGTENMQPTLLLAWSEYGALNFSDQVANVIISLAHELGHAYFRSVGWDYDPSEEDIVERFGVMVYEESPGEAVEYLGAIEGPAPFIEPSWARNPKKLKAKLLR